MKRVQLRKLTTEMAVKGRDPLTEAYLDSTPSPKPTLILLQILTFKKPKSQAQKPGTTSCKKTGCGIRLSVEPDVL